MPSSIDLFIIWVVMGAKTAAYSFTSDDDIGSNSHILACDYLDQLGNCSSGCKLKFIDPLFCGIITFEILTRVRSGLNGSEGAHNFIYFFQQRILLKSFARVLSQVVGGSGSGSFLLRRVLNILKRALGS